MTSYRSLFTDEAYRLSGKFHLPVLAKSKFPSVAQVYVARISITIIISATATSLSVNL